MYGKNSYSYLLSIYSFTDKTNQEKVILIDKKKYLFEKFEKGNKLSKIQLKKILYEISGKLSKQNFLLLKVFCFTRKNQNNFALK